MKVSVKEVKQLVREALAEHQRATQQSLNEQALRNMIRKLVLETLEEEHLEEDPPSVPRVPRVPDLPTGPAARPRVSPEALPPASNPGTTVNLPLPPESQRPVNEMVRKAVRQMLKKR